MYDDLKRQIEQRLNQVPRFHIERMATGGIDAERDISFFSAHVTAELDRYTREMYDDIDATEAAAHPRNTIPDFGGFQTQRQMEKHFLEQISMDIGSSITAFDYTVPSGSRVFGPPYDRTMVLGNGLSFGGQIDGKVYTIQTPNGISEAGIGFYLTTDEPVLAAITPQGTYDFSWAAFEFLPFARSRGGMGITIYTDSEDQPTLSRTPVLWSISAMTALTGHTGNGQIADAASPAFGLGTVPLAPALLNMVPGSRYLVWVWCWQIAKLEPNDRFIAWLQFAMPFVTIDAGPPILLH